MKKIISLLLMLAFISPLMAKEKKAKPIKGKVISITAEAVTLKVKKDEKTFKISDQTKILDKDGTEVASGEADFAVAMIKVSSEDTSVASLIKEHGKAPKKKK